MEKGEEYTRRNLELRAADFYASLRKPESEWKTIDDLAPQLAEFEHRVHAEDYEGACRVLEPIDFDYLFLWGYYARLVEMREKLLGRLKDPSLRAANLGSLGRAYSNLGQVEQAIGYYQQSLVIARKIGDRQNESIWLSDLGYAYNNLGQFEQAIKLYEKALPIAREIGDRRQEGSQINCLGLTYRALGRLEQAIECHEKSLNIARAISDRALEGLNLGNLGSVYSALGQFERATNLYEEAFAIAREIGDRREKGSRLGSLGDVYRALGQAEKAVKLLEDALVITREIGDRQREGRHLDNLGSAYYAVRQSERAVKLHEEALTIAREIGDRRGESYRLLGMGKALLTIEKLSEGRQHCAEALALEVPETSYQAALALGIVLLQQRDPAAGKTFADAAARCRALLDKTADLYEARYALAAALIGRAVCDPRWAEEGERAGLLAPALEEYRRALENCAAPGVVQDALRDLEMIRAAGVEGLEPIFELLESARP